MKSPVTSRRRVSPVTGSAQDDTLEVLVAEDLGDLAVPRELDLGVAQGALGHDRAGPQLVTAVDDRHLRREAAEERRLLDGGVATTDDRDLLVAEEEAVTRGTPAHTVAGEGLLAGQAELAVAGAHRQDHGRGEVLVAGRVADYFHVTPQVHRRDVIAHQLGAELLGLLAQVVHQRRTHDAVRETREVLDLGRGHQGAASRHRPFEHKRVQVRPGGVDRSCVPCRS